MTDNLLKVLNRKNKIIRNSRNQVVPHLIQGSIPIKETMLIDSSRLIQSYISPKGRRVKVHNWFNCSFINFRNRNYFVYRMEPRPYCRIMKIGICLLDESLQPLKDTNVLLNLHTDLKDYYYLRKSPDGFHAEDPRLFIHENQLYLSYTDGYRMAQAKINPDTLQSEESYYINKPVEGRTEKNWTFFSYENELFSIYTGFNQRIFLMNKSNWEERYVSETITWDYGEIRGGTSPIFLSDKFLTFFHSSLAVRLKRRLWRQYYMGAYTFESKPPFKILAITKTPIIAGEYMNPLIRRLSNKIFVVFPGGIIERENSFLVSFGYNDYECRYVEVDKNFLNASMNNIIPVK